MRTFASAPGLLSLFLAACAPQAAAAPVGSAAAQRDAARPTLDARTITQRLLITDGHVDVPWRLDSKRDAQGNVSEDVSVLTTSGHFDYARAREGGLDAPFMSIYVPARLEDNGAKQKADALIDIVEKMVSSAPERFALATRSSDLRANFDRGVLSLPMGMENGAPLEHNLANVAYFHGRGIRYITLAHSRHNHLSDSSFDDSQGAGGLTPFGRKVVHEMNRVGIMVDVSHLSDAAFWHVLEETKVPVIASHSSCRAFTPGWQRNIADDMIVALAKQPAGGGVVMVNFGLPFIDEAANAAIRARWEAVDARLAAAHVAYGEHGAERIIEAAAKEFPLPQVALARVADHIDHIVHLVGIEHVGLGSDFDGLDDFPEGLKDVSAYPNLFQALIERGYTESDLALIASENLIRVWQAVETFAESSK